MTIAIWCIFIAATLPYVAFALVKGLNPVRPRLGIDNLDGRSQLAYGAHLNGLETFPWFAAAVIVSHMIGGPSRAADILAVLYVLVRAGHMAAYMAERQPVRTTLFTAGQIIALAIFILPLFR
jgi:uncharacterized MAPEG superfamily protein